MKDPSDLPYPFFLCLYFPLAKLNAKAKTQSTIDLVDAGQPAGPGSRVRNESGQRENIPCILLQRCSAVKYWHSKRSGVYYIMCYKLFVGK